MDINIINWTNQLIVTNVCLHVFNVKILDKIGFGSGVNDKNECNLKENRHELQNISQKWKLLSWKQ